MAQSLLSDPRANPKQSIPHIQKDRYNPQSRLTPALLLQTVRGMRNR